MKIKTRFLSIFTLLAIFALTFTVPAQAFDSRTGENIVIKADEVVNDDLYVTANAFTLEGIVKGDLVVTGTAITINGTVEGDLIAAGQSVVINGTVTDDARIAGAVLQIGGKANIGDDLVAGGASLEVQDGSKVGGDIAAGAGQALLAGEVIGDAYAGAGALELRGKFGGDVKVEVGDPEQGGDGPPMSMFMSMFMQESQVSVPEIPSGLTIAKDARIKGNFEYTQIKEINVPANVVGGDITHKQPVIDPAIVEAIPTPAEVAMAWTFNLLRAITTLVIFGLLLGWLAPAFVQMLMEKTQTKTAASLGWGFVAIAAFFFAILVVIVVMGVGGAFFGALTLGGITTFIVFGGVLALFALIFGFLFTAFYVTQVVVARLIGKLIFARVNPELTEHTFIPLIVGAAILAVLMALPFIGKFFSLLATIIGLGAIWLWGSEMRQAGKAAQ